jgi:hypothetical protein
MREQISLRRLEKLRRKLETLYTKGKFDEALELSRMLDPILVNITREKSRIAAARGQECRLTPEKSW